MSKITGLIAAVYTPMQQDQSLRLESVKPMVEHLIDWGMQGIYICGSTGEGISLTGEERKAVAEAYQQATEGRMLTAVQVGHNSLREAQELARHAAEIGADLISATAPSYFKCASIEGLVACMAEIAEAAPNLPFYYYHIPSLTGVKLDMLEFLRQGSERIPNLAGIKYTDHFTADFLACQQFENSCFDLVWGCDEMLLSALAIGAQGAIGSTYNFAAPIYQRIMHAFKEGNHQMAIEWQAHSVQLVRTLNKYPFHAASKQVLSMLGLEFGPCRLPQSNLRQKAIQQIERDLKSIGFFEWINVEKAKIKARQ